jgi:hypothetical protein
MTRKTAERHLAPVPREWLDVTMPGFRGLLGAAFVVFSSYATVFLVASDLAFLGDRESIGLFPDRYWCGVAAALAFFLGEVYTSERWPKVYRAILVPDTVYTARQLYPGLMAGLTVLVKQPLDLVIVAGLAAGVALLIAYASDWSIWGHILLLLGASALLGGALLGWSLAVAVFVLACMISLYIGGIVARFGEVFLFGKRR